ncbi:hypothetical protein BGZ65_002882, partial [Modicella reniformis]
MSGSGGGQRSFGIESTVVDGLRVPPAILRPGLNRFDRFKVQVYKKLYIEKLKLEARDVIEFPLGQGSKSEDVARELSRGLRYLDGQNVDCIFAEESMKKRKAWR